MRSQLFKASLSNKVSRTRRRQGIERRGNIETCIVLKRHHDAVSITSSQLPNDCKQVIRAGSKGFSHRVIELPNFTDCRALTLQPLSCKYRKLADQETGTVISLRSAAVVT